MYIRGWFRYKHRSLGMIFWFLISANVTDRNKIRYYQGYKGFHIHWLVTHLLNENVANATIALIISVYFNLIIYTSAVDQLSALLFPQNSANQLVRYHPLCTWYINYTSMHAWNISIVASSNCMVGLLSICQNFTEEVTLHNAMNIYD